MSEILRNVQIPLFIKIEHGILARVQDILNEHHLHFRRPLVVTEEHILELGGKDVVHSLGDPAIALTADNSLEEAGKLVEEIRAKRNDVLIALGGGRVLDLVKYTATRARINYISIPTSPSNDGLCSPVAVLKNDQGITESIGVNMPIGVLVDTAMMASVPLRNIQSGIGDLLSNFSAIHDWRLAHAQQKESLDDFAASIAYSAAQLIFETCRGADIDLHSDDFLGKLVHGLILSGIAMNISGNSRPCSGGEHEISHAIDALYPGRSMHGLQVAFGTLIASYLRGEDIAAYVSFCRAVGLPVTTEELGLSREELITAIEKAPDTRPDRYTVLEQRALDRAGIEELVDNYHAHVATLV